MSKWPGCPIIACKNDLCSERCMFDTQHAVGFRDGYSPETLEAEKPQERLAWTVDEFCAAFGGICRATFYNEVRAGRLRAVKLGSKTLVLRQDAEIWAMSLPTMSSPSRR